jgi:hypothetical protein
VLFGALSLSLHAAVFEALRTPRSLEEQASKEAAGGLVGDTLEVEAPTTPLRDDDSPSPNEPRPTTAARVTPASSHAPNAGASEIAGRPSRESRSAPDARALFGAVGVRFATDLSATFTRALPQASSADPAWIEAPFGPAGWAEVAIVLDEAGHVVSRAVSGSPSPALRSSIEKTLSLLGERVFTSRQSLTRLRVTARVTRDSLHDGLHGDVFALSGGSFASDVGSAFFTLPAESGPGRRVDAEVRNLR